MKRLISDVEKTSLSWRYDLLALQLLFSNSFPQYKYSALMNSIYPKPRLQPYRCVFSSLSAFGFLEVSQKWLASPFF